MTRADRFNKLIRYIIWTFDVPFQSAIKTVAEKAGVGHSNLSTALGGNERYLTDSIMNKVNVAYDEPFRKEWLLFETGDMLKDNSQVSIADSADIVISQQETIRSLTESLAALTVLIKQR